MSPTALSDEQRSAVETFVTDWLTEQRIPGAAIAVVDGDDVVFAEGLGARTLEDNAPATPDTLFGIGSCTKSFTATAIMQLAEGDRLALEEPIDEYIPHLSDGSGDPITVEELLTHTSGMPSDGAAGPLMSRSLGLGHVEVPLSSEADFRRHVQGSADRRVTDHDAFFYYNSGYTLLGQIIETVTEKSFAAYVEEQILDPIGMERSTFDRGAFASESDRMTPYIKQEGSSTESAFPFDPLLHPPGGLVSSVRELAEWLRLYLENGTVNGERILTSESVEAMTTPLGRSGPTSMAARSATDMG